MKISVIQLVCTEDFAIMHQIKEQVNEKWKSNNSAN